MTIAKFLKLTGCYDPNKIDPNITKEVESDPIFKELYKKSNKKVDDFINKYFKNLEELKKTANNPSKSLPEKQIANEKFAEKITAIENFLSKGEFCKEEYKKLNCIEYEQGNIHLVNMNLRFIIPRINLAYKNFLRENTPSPTGSSTESSTSTDRGAGIGHGIELPPAALPPIGM